MIIWYYYDFTLSVFHRCAAPCREPSLTSVLHAIIRPELSAENILLPVSEPQHCSSYLNLLVMRDHLNMLRR